MLGLKGIKVWVSSIKLLEENIGNTLSDINHSRILYDPPPRVMEIYCDAEGVPLVKFLRLFQR